MFLSPYFQRLIFENAFSKYQFQKTSRSHFFQSFKYLKKTSPRNFYKLKTKHSKRNISYKNTNCVLGFRIYNQEVLSINIIQFYSKFYLDIGN